MYASNQGDATVAVIDVETLDVVTTVDLKPFGFDENAKPHHIAVEPDGSYWYISLIGANRVLKLDRENRLVGQAEFEVPGMLADALCRLVPLYRYCAWSDESDFLFGS